MSTQPSLHSEALTPRCPTKRLIVSASIGNALELFDFTVFSFFASIIGAEFFPSTSRYGSLLMAVSIFGVGFIMRPLGGMLLGAYADRAGRKSALLLTIVLMGLGTATIALAPTYAQVGIAAPVIILIGRLIQGFSAGGEIGASTTLLLESAGQHQRGFFLSWQVASQGISSLLGGLCGALLSATLSVEALHAWGWRIPFLVGLIIIPVGLFIRRQIDETLIPTHREIKQKNPVSIFLKHYGLQFILGLSLIMAATLMTYIIIFYMPTYMMQVTDVTATTSYMISLGVSVVLVVSGIVSGMTLDKIPHYRRITMASVAVALLLTYPAFALLSHPATLWWAVLLRLIIVASLGFNMTAGMLLIATSLPRDVRATGLSMTYATGVAIFGGTAQFIVTWLLDTTGAPLSPAWYLIGMLVLSLIGCYFFKEKHLA